MFGRLMKLYPATTQILTTGVLFASGDLITQFAVEQKSIKEYSINRTVQLTGFGLCISGPAMIPWYRFLNTHFHSHSKIRGIVSRVAMDQIIFAPTFLAIFFIYNGIMDGSDRESIRKRLVKAYPDALIANWGVWPLVQLINFKFVQLNYQTVFVNIVALGWNTYMNQLNQRVAINISNTKLDVK